MLSKYYPDGPSWFKNITLAQLITHRSGIPDYLNDEEFSAQLLPMLGADAALIGGLVFGKPMTNAIVVDTVLKGLSSLTEPYVLPEGTSRYSNTGYLLLADVLEMAAKKPFPLLAEEIIFTPNGMTHSYVSTLSAEKTKGAATGYEKSADGYQALHDNLAAYGDGSVVTTVQDFAKWMSVLLNSTNETSPWFGFLQDPKQQQLPKLGYAFYGNGLVISDYSGWFYEHAGKSIDRMESNFWVSPENAVGYVQMCNSAASIQARNYEVIRWVLSSRKDH